MDSLKKFKRQENKENRLPRIQMRRVSEKSPSTQRWLEQLVNRKPSALPVKYKRTKKELVAFFKPPLTQRNNTFGQLRASAASATRSNRNMSDINRKAQGFLGERKNSLPARPIPRPPPLNSKFGFTFDDKARMLIESFGQMSDRTPRDRPITVQATKSHTPDVVTTTTQTEWSVQTSPEEKSEEPTPSPTPLKLMSRYS